MTSITSRALPPPNNWQDFEALAYDLFKRVWETDDAHLHGRSGQEQHGVDVYGTDRVHDKWVGVQCKGKNSDYGASVTKVELQKEVEKAKAFKPKLDRFILVTTAPNDKVIQEEARRLNAENKRLGLFQVDIFGWEELKHLIQDHPEVLRTHFPGMAPGLPELVVEKIDEVKRHFSSEFERRLPTAQGDARSAIVSVPVGADSHDRLGQRITDIASLLKKAPPQHVLDMLIDLWEAEARCASDRHRYRIKANMASAYWMLGQREDACRCFQEAGEEIPGEGDGLAALATVEWLEGRAEQAFDLSSRALELQPESERAAGILVESAPADMPWRELQQMLPEKFQQNPGLLVALAERAIRHGEEKEANHLSASARKRDPEDWLVLARAGLISFSKVADKEEIRFLRVLNTADRAVVEEASSRFSEAWKQLKASGWPAQGDWVAANYASTLLLLGDTVRADDVIKNAVTICGPTPSLLHVKAMRHLDQEEWDEAVVSLDAIPEDRRDANDRLMMIQAFIRKKDGEAALRAATHLYDTNDDESVRIAAASARMMAAAGISDESVEREAEIVLRAHPNVPILLATYLGLTPGSPNSDIIQKRLLDCLSPDADPFTRDRAAHALYGAEAFSASANLFRSLSDPAVDSPQLRLALKALARSRRLKEARELYRKLGRTVLANPEVRRIGTWILEASGHLIQAREEFEACLALDGDSLEDRLSWLSLCIRIPDYEAAAAYLRNVDVDVEGSPQARMQLAQFMDRLIDDPFKVLEIGYRALRDGYDDPQMHASFIIGLFFMGRSGRNVDLKRETVGADTAVVLSAKDKPPIVRVLETASNPMARFDEISIDCPFSQRLIGKKVGDQIEMTSVTGGYTATITEIQSKYVHAQARALRDSERMFPENKFLGGLKIDEDDVKGSIQPMLDDLRRRREVVHRLEEAYATGAAPLPLLSQFAGGSVFDLWDHIRHHPELNMRVAEGSHPERQKAYRDISASPGTMIVDPLTLYGIVGLGIADELLATCPDIMITRSSIDLLQGALMHRETELQDPDRSGTMVAVDDGYVIVDRSREQDAALIEQLSKAIELTSRFVVVMPEEGASLAPELEDIFSEVAPCFVDTMIVAKERDIPVLTDDLALRKVIWEEGLKAAWTQVVMQHARDDGRLEKEKYVDVVLALLDKDFGYTSIDTTSILHEWNSAGRKANDRLEKLLIHVASPSNDRSSVAGLLAGLFLEAWGDGTNRSDCDSLAEYVASSLIAGGGEEAAQTTMKAVVATAIRRHQGFRRAEILPGRLRSTTSLAHPNQLSVDIDEACREAVENSVGGCIRRALLPIEARGQDHRMKPDES